MNAAAAAAPSQIRSSYFFRALSSCQSNDGNDVDDAVDPHTHTHTHTHKTQHTNQAHKVTSYCVL